MNKENASEEVNAPRPEKPDITFVNNLIDEMKMSTVQCRLWIGSCKQLSTCFLFYISLSNENGTVSSAYLKGVKTTTKGSYR